MKNMKEISWYLHTLNTSLDRLTYGRKLKLPPLSKGRAGEGIEILELG